MLQYIYRLCAEHGSIKMDPGPRWSHLVSLKAHRQFLFFEAHSRFNGEILKLYIFTYTFRPCLFILVLVFYCHQNRGCTGESTVIWVKFGADLCKSPVLIWVQDFRSQYSMDHTQSRLILIIRFKLIHLILAHSAKIG